jgi:ribosomal protein S18 acetylase RimI-like enzyme
LTFRRATPDDLEDVLAVIARCDAAAEGWAPPGEGGDRARVTELLASRGHFNEVAEVGDRVVGYVNAHERDGGTHLAYLFVDPACHGRGIGGALMARALEDGRRRGSTRATLSTAVDNVPARRFYEHTGWSDTGERVRNERLGLEMASYALDL